jgi:hypothetical protein
VFVTVALVVVAGGRLACKALEEVMVAVTVLVNTVWTEGVELTKLCVGLGSGGCWIELGCDCG